MDAKEFWTRLRKEGSLSPEMREELIRIYGERGEKALLALDRRMVKKYLDFVVVAGASREYVVEDDFCSCQDFMYRGKCCWHIIAASLAGMCGSFETCDLWYQDSWRTRG